MPFPRAWPYCWSRGSWRPVFYPAFVLSSFKPMVVLKGKYSASVGGAWLRKILVVGQFAITITLIIGSLVVFRQLRFMSNQQLGMR